MPFRIFISLITVFVFLQCNPDDASEINDCTECGPYYLGEIEDYLYFKPGSWWVYKNTFTEELDTLVMKSSSKRMRKIVGDKRTVTYEHIDFILTSKVNQAKYTYSQVVPFPDPAAPYRHKVWIDKGRTNPYVGHTQPFAWAEYYKPDMIVGGGSGNDTYYRGKSDSLVIQGQVYFDIMEFETTDDFSFIYGEEHWENGGPTIYLWAKGVGLIRNGSLKFKQNWELVSYHIAD